jgi:hypothetical protein
VLRRSTTSRVSSYSRYSPYPSGPNQQKENGCWSFRIKSKEHSLSPGRNASSPDDRMACPPEATRHKSVTVGVTTPTQVAVGGRSPVVDRLQLNFTQQDSPSLFRRLGTTCVHCPQRVLHRLPCLRQPQLCDTGSSRAFHSQSQLQVNM